jgi:hypothetical protein
VPPGTFATTQGRAGDVPPPPAAAPQGAAAEGGASSMSKLPEDPWRYFNKTPEAVMLPMSALTPVRARPKGIANANKYMQMAYDGEMEKRKPISVKANGDGTYTVLDGNSTYANAKASGWSEIPATVES